MTANAHKNKSFSVFRCVDFWCATRKYLNTSDLVWIFLQWVAAFGVEFKSTRFVIDAMRHVEREST